MTASQHDLWDYALAIYDLRDVKSLLLKLQDRYHLDVGMVIWCLWCGRYGYKLDKATLDQALAAAEAMWRHTTRPLRTVRLFLSAPKYGFPEEALRALRQDVLKTELASEELVLRRLDAVTRKISAPNPDLHDMAARSEQLFTLARDTVDTPIMIADEESPHSPLSLFRKLRLIVEAEGP